MSLQTFTLFRDKLVCKKPFPERRKSNHYCVFAIRQYVAWASAFITHKHYQQEKNEKAGGNSGEPALRLFVKAVCSSLESPYVGKRSHCCFNTTTPLNIQAYRMYQLVRYVEKRFLWDTKTGNRKTNDTLDTCVAQWWWIWSPTTLQIIAAITALRYRRQAAPTTTFPPTSYVCVFHMNPSYLQLVPLDFQHTQCPCWFVILER